MKRFIKKLFEYKHIYLALSFFIPFFTMGLAYACQGTFPFGDRQIMISDFWHQYYPFLVELQNKLQNGGSLLYSWNGGLGTNFLSMASYYLMSPLNFLVVLVPPSLLREAVVLFMMTKIGCAGLFMALFLLKVLNREEDKTLPVFASMYALCTYVIGYCWNIMWMDTFALMPLVILGTLSIIKEGKFKLYIVTLALSIIANYYIGYIVCVFTAISFFAGCICYRVSFKTFFKRLMQIAFYTLIGIGLTAFITIPAYIGLTETYSISNKFPTKVEFYESFFDIIGNFSYISMTTVLDGLPNVFSSMFCFMLLPIYFSMTEIKMREKITVFLLIVFMVVSCNFNMLNFIWHAFHITNMIPYRFSFIIPFIITIIGFRTFPRIKEIDFIDAALMVLAGLLTVVCAYFGPQQDICVAAGAALLIVYALILVFIVKYTEKKQLGVNILLVFMLFEVCSSAVILYGNTGTSQRSIYPEKYDDVQVLLDEIEGKNTRVEMSNWKTTNDPMLYHYKGVTQFSSMVKVDVTNFSRAIGLSAVDRQNRYLYTENSPFLNNLLGVNYMISKSGNIAAPEYWNAVKQENNSILYKSKYPLSIGYMVSGHSDNLALNYSQPFDSQNSVFSTMTGVKFNLFETENRQVFKCKDNFVWNYTMPRDGVLYVYTDGPKTKKLNISSGEQAFEYENSYASILCAGTYNKGDIVKFEFELREGDASNITVYTSFMNTDVFEKGYAELADEQLNITQRKDTVIEGNVNAQKDGILYMAVPYEDGWTAYVDGQKAEIIKIGKAMCGINIEAGNHDIRFEYFPEGLLPGLIITTTAAWSFVMMCFRKKKKIIE